MIPTTPEILAALPWIVFAVVVPILLRRQSPIDRYPPPTPEEAPMVSVIVPMRNEAENITTCMSTLLATKYPRWEIIIVDDDSVDGTADIARAIAEGSRGTVIFVAGKPLPPGWLGKSWACWQGYQMASGDVLLFTDADTRHNEALLGHAVGALMAEKADLATVLPRQLMESPWERIVLPHIFVTIMLRFHDVAKLSRTRNPRAVIANGQFMLFTREGYLAVGGHESVRDTVVEDLRLAQRVVEEDRRLLAAHAENLMETRMYRSLRGIIEGWSKNVALGSREAVPRWFAPYAAWILGILELCFWVVPPAVLLASLFGDVGEFLAGWSLTASVVSYIFWLAIALQFRIPTLTALFYPVGGLVTTGIFLRSAIRGERVQWRGREYRGDRRAEETTGV
ncbi:MAG TPA: glycosyltransferase family 2 protein [Longimicrobiales bacterium]